MRERVLRLLEGTKIPQAEVARRMGKSANWLSRRLLPDRRGNIVDFTADDVPKLAEAFSVSILDLYSERAAELPSPEVPLTDVAEAPDYFDVAISRAAQGWPEEERELLKAVLRLRHRYRGPGQPQRSAPTESPAQ